MIQSLKKRYTAKLFANLIGSSIGVITAIIVPRALGPKAYGDFTFLSTFFLSLIGFFTLSTSDGFYVKLSQRPNEFGLISFYGYFNMFTILALFIFVAGSQLLGVSGIIWIDQSIGFVYMATLFSAFGWLVKIITYVVDAYGLTVSTEIVRIFQKLIGLLIITALFLCKQLNLKNYFFYNYGLTIVLILLFIWIINRNNYSFFQSWKLRKDQISGYIKEFYEYSRPLFFFALIQLVFGIFDRWLLQKYGGSVQQGFFGFSYQITIVCFLFSSAMTPLIIREFSIAYHKNDISEMSRLFRRYIPILYSITAYFACFASVQAEKITYIFGGRQFTDATIPVMIMALTPIHQTYGQLSASVFFATGQTKLFSRISIGFIIIGLPMIYFLLAPVDKFGFNAGAIGLAIKVVLIQFIYVNVQLFYNSKFLKMRFINYFAHQIISVCFLIAIALLVKVFINGIQFMNDHILLNFLISGLLYSLLVLISVFYFPVIFGLRKEDMKIGLNEIIIYLKKEKFNE